MFNPLGDFRRFFRHIPYKIQNFGDACVELISIFLFGFMPIWLSILFSWLSPEGTVVAFLNRFFSSGEALLMSSALVGPLVYVIFKRYGDLPKKLTLRFPFGWFYMSLIFLICVITAGVFGYNSATSESDKILSENMRFLSVTILAVSLTILFLVSTIRNFMERGPTKIMHDDTVKFLESWD